MIRIHHSATCNAPVAVAFAVAADYRTWPNWLFGLESMEPVDEQTSGAGAVFRGAMKVGPTTLKSNVQIVEWVQDKAIAFDSISGFRNVSRWEFAEVGADVSKISVEVAYESPGGLAGRALGRILEPFITVCIQRTDTALRQQIESEALKRA